MLFVDTKKVNVCNIIVDINFLKKIHLLHPHLSSTMLNTTGLISMWMILLLPQLSTNVPTRLQTLMVIR